MAPKRGTKKADRVLLLAKDVEQRRQAYVDGHLKGSAEVHPVASWEEMVKALAGYAVISELTIFGHAGPGSFLFKQPGGGFKGTTLEQAADFYRSQAGVARPAATTIHLQSCNIGLSPLPLVAYAEVFGATTIQAWNHFYVTSTKTLTIPMGATADDLSKALFNEIGYLPDDVSLEDLAKRPGRHDVLVEWFRVEEDEAPLPPRSKTIDANPARKPFKRVASAELRRVRSEAELKALGKELGEWGFQEPAKPLLKIVIETAGLSGGAAPPGQ